MEITKVADVYSIFYYIWLNSDEAVNAHGVISILETKFTLYNKR